MTMKMFNDIYKNKKVLVTGNTGFKGSWLSIWLLKLGAKVYGISKDIPTEPSMFEEVGLEKKIVHYNKDVRDLKSVKEIINKIKPDFLFHLAAQSLVSVSYTVPVDTISTNVLGTANILEALRTSNHNCIGIIITSDKCYDNVEWVWGYKETDALGGKDIYSGSKGAAELIIKSYHHSFFNKSDSNVKIVSVRAGNVIGGGDWAKDRIVPDCIRSWSNDEIVEIRSPNATRPWQHVLEPLAGYLQLGEQLLGEPLVGAEAWNFGPPPEAHRPVRQVIEAFAEAWPAVRFQIDGATHPHEAQHLHLDCSKAAKRLHWHPVWDLPTTLRRSALWYRQQHEQGALRSHEDLQCYVRDARQLARVWAA